MTRAEIITIGTELLLGDVIDTNTSYIARKLRQSGIDLMRTTTVGDNPGRIAEQIKTSLQSADIVITTGGLGPTVDDPTREAIALAFSQPLVFHADLWENISARFLSRGLTPTINNQRQAYLPQGAEVIQNPVGTAPAFWIPDGKKMVVCLPGVPDEMKTILEQSVLPLLSDRYCLKEILHTRILHVCCMGESAIDNLIAEYEAYSNPTVGLCAHPGYVDIRIAAKSDSKLQAEEMIGKIEQEIRSLLPGVIFGIDDIELVGAIQEQNQKQDLAVHIQLLGFPEELVLDHIGPLQSSIEFINSNERQLSEWLILSPVENLTILAGLIEANNQVTLDLYQKTKHNSVHTQRIYLGPPSQGTNWALNTVLGVVWKALNQEFMEKK